MLFCSKEDQEHLFFSCSLAGYIWMVVKCTFSFNQSPANFKKILETWSLHFVGKDINLVVLRIAAVIRVLRET